MSEETHSVRLDRVESEVGAMRSDMGGLRTEVSNVQADVRSLGTILKRIEEGMLRAQDQQDQKEAQSRHSPVAVATVLITFMSMLVGGAWMIGSNAARMDERTNMLLREQDRTDARMWYIDHGGQQRGESNQTGQ